MPDDPQTPVPAVPPAADPAVPLAPASGNGADTPTAAAPTAEEAIQPDTPSKPAKPPKTPAETLVRGSKGNDLPTGVSPDEVLAALGTKRGVETLFRSSYGVNMDLTALADSKANIMISINGLIISILIAQIASKVDANPWLLAPTVIFLVGCLGSIIFAILAARPRIQTRVVTLEEARRTRINILFFGNFAHMSQDDFITVMKERLSDPKDLYEMMMADVYGVGSVLQAKYRLLRASYGTFLLALVLGVISFIVVFGYAATTQSGPTYVPPATDEPSSGLLP